MPAPPKSDDPLPRNTIRLSDAFERYYRTTGPNVSAVEVELNAALPGPVSLGDRGASAAMVPIYRRPSDEQTIPSKGFIWRCWV
jgi:hypothetical protein